MESIDVLSLILFIKPFRKYIADEVMNRFLAFAFCLLVLTSSLLKSTHAWSNGGFSSDPLKPDYGTHDWIAEHALDWLPEEVKYWIVANLPLYLYGTELPDNGRAPDGIGDTSLHHIYFNSKGVLVDDSAAVRANATYNEALSYLISGNISMAAKYAGIMSHYLADMAVFCHVMGSGTDWGAETHHSDYEAYVNGKTSSYDAEFNMYLSFDGQLEIISAYEAAVKLAYDTTFDSSGRGLTCVWMDRNYNWDDRTFRERVGESLNLAINYLADVLYTLYMQSQPNYPFPAKVLVTFSAIGLSPDALGTILRVDGVNYSYFSLPVGFLWEVGSSHSFEWKSIVYANPEKRFLWNSTIGLFALRAGSIVVPNGSKGSESIFATYKTQYRWTFSAEGLAQDALGRIVAIDWKGAYSHAFDDAYDLSKMPVSFWWDEGTVHRIVYAEYVDSMVKGKRYAIHEAPRLNLTVSRPGNLIPSYHAEYELTIFETSIGGRTDPPGGTYWFDDGSTVRLVAQADTGYVFYGWVGTYNSTSNPLQITVQGAPIYLTANFILAFDFSVSVNPSSGAIQKGGSLHITIEVRLLNGTAQPVTLAVSGLPSGISHELSVSSGIPPFTCILTIAPGPLAPTGIYEITIRGVGGALNRTAIYTLTIIEPERVLYYQPWFLMILSVIAVTLLIVLLAYVIESRK
jgi:hypothetical protein